MPFKPSAYCEPFCIKDGYNFEIHHVEYADNDPYSCFMHFHEVHELIFFEKVDGTFFYHQGESKLADFDVVFTPAMETHDFELTTKGKSWFIVQFPARLFDIELLKNQLSFFQSAMHLRVAEQYQPQLLQVIRWLHQSFNENPHSAKSLSLLKLAIVLLAEHSQTLIAYDAHSLSSTPTFAKIQPLVELFRHQLSVDLSLKQAAQKCHLSPSYFSRVFKNVFRYPYSEYAVRHKLYNAARLLGQSESSVTNISYELNFSSPSHFIALFKKQFGHTPKQYRMALLARAQSAEAIHPRVR